MIFRSSGKAGDLVYSLPVIQHFGGGMLYIPYDAPEVPGFYDNMHTFIESQGIECKPYVHTGGYMESLPHDVDIDLDWVRLQPHRGRKFMVQQYFDAFGIKDKVPERWVKLEAPYHGDALVNVTPRHRDKCRYKWDAVPENATFIGTPDEWDSFPVLIPYAPSLDFLSLARKVAGASEIWCSQSSVLTLAQAMGIKYYCTFKPGKTNCIMGTPNEHKL